MKLCECKDGCQCQQKAGPAVFAVKREGVGDLNVCSRCFLSDIDTKVGMVNMTELSMKDLIDYDPIFAFVVLANPDTIKLEE